MIPGRLEPMPSFATEKLFYYLSHYKRSSSQIVELMDQMGCDKN